MCKDKTLTMKSIFILLFILITGCTTHAQKFSYELTSPEEFKQFSSLPLSSKYGNVSSIKVVYDLNTNKLYFLNSRFFKYHHDFCESILADETPLFEFNEINYSEDITRAYLLGNINYYPSQSKYVLELAPSDKMDKTQILKLYQKIMEHSYLKNNLSFLLSTQRLENLKDSLGKEMSTSIPSDIYENLNYQAISCHETTGILRFLKTIDQLDKSDHSNDIIVLEEIPNFLPLVRGIIVTSFQTPLSHISLLGQNRKIPICACKNIFTAVEFEKFKNKIVRYSVMSDTFSLEISDKIYPETVKNTITLKKDLTHKELVDVEKLDKYSSSYVGNKASNFGILNKISKISTFKVPEAAFAIPFFYYIEHAVNSTAKEKINKLLASAETQNSPELLKKALKEIQDSILHFPVRTDLIKMIQTKLKENPNYTLFRFRSSTNAEDANGFSGAGLYDSKTVDLANNEKSIEKALLKVWASLWSYEAFMERAYFGINQNEVCMGILVHRAFPNEAVNGVAITKNIYRNNYIGFVVNAQKGDESVVAPKKGIICDQFICFPGNNGDFYENSIDVITNSNINNGELVMSNEEMQNLANQLEIIKRQFASRFQISFSNYNEFGLDIEFKLDESTRQLYIKQARIYND